jgi:hypothetical protein
MMSYTVRENMKMKRFESFSRNNSVSLIEGERKVLLIFSFLFFPILAILVIFATRCFCCVAITMSRNNLYPLEKRQWPLTLCGCFEYRDLKVSHVCLWFAAANLFVFLLVG